MSGARVPVVVAGIVAMLAILASLFVNLASSLVPTDWIKCHRLLITGGLGVLTVVSVIVAAWQVRLNTGGNDLKPGQQNQDMVAGIDLDRDQNSRFGYSFAIRNSGVVEIQRMRTVMPTLSLEMIISSSKC